MKNYIQRFVKFLAKTGTLLTRLDNLLTNQDSALYLKRTKKDIFLIWRISIGK